MISQRGGRGAVASPWDRASEVRRFTCGSDSSSRGRLSRTRVAAVRTICALEADELTGAMVRSQKGRPRPFSAGNHGRLGDHVPLHRRTQTDFRQHDDIVDVCRASGEGTLQLGAEIDGGNRRRGGVRWVAARRRRAASAGRGDSSYSRTSRMPSVPRASTSHLCC